LIPIKQAILDEFESLLMQVGHSWDGERRASVLAAAQDYAQLQWLVMTGHDEAAGELAIAGATLSNYEVAGELTLARLFNEAVTRAIAKASQFLLEVAL
jgi:hypothetical protein